MNLNQITLPALDIKRSSDFYRRMGFTQIVDSPDYARFECPEGNSTFSLHRVAEAAAPTGVVVYFENAKLDALVADLENSGFEFVSGPEDQCWLWREARLLDPSGNEVCLYHAGRNRRYPPWRVTVAG